MNKTALKKFATSARRELLEKVELQARKLGITSEAIQKANVESSDALYIDGRQLSNIERRQRNKLISRVKEIGFERVIEETAYTWFNRFVALRYMEVNEYLPTKVRVLSSSTGSAEPDMMKQALSLNLSLDKEYVYELKMQNKTDELFKYLIKIHCNDLNRYMPFMFETIEDYTELLFPEGLLGTDSFVRAMTDTEGISEESWSKVEIIGWLYQYYISEENERVIKAKKRYKAEEIPFATQLFTPEWIVRYMVQNALGRYWIESHKEHRDLIENWEFYLENPNPEEDLEEKLSPYVNKVLNIEDVKCFDPAMGSGHILVYMFDVLYQIYNKCGYMERDIPRLIIEKNLYGLDIDDRAYQLASFSVVMKALQYNKRFLRSIERDGLILNLASIQETNKFTNEEVAFLAGESSGEQFEKMKNFINQFRHAKSIGSLIKLEYLDLDFLKERLTKIEQQSTNLFEVDLRDRTYNLYKSLINQSELMNLKYDIFITNPPYAGNKYLTKEVSTYLTKYYPRVKSDLFSSFIEYSFYSTKEYGQIGFMTPFVWMYISSFEELRQMIIKNKMISSLIQLEYSAFDGATVPICSFCLRNYPVQVNGEYIKLSDFKGSENQPIKTIEAIRNPTAPYRYTFKQINFDKVPGSPIVFWISDTVRNIFEFNDNLYNYTTSASQNITGNNKKYLRFHWEVDKFNVGKEKKWVFYAKGGGFRKWYGNMLEVVDWSEEAREIYRTGHSSQIISKKYWYKKGITWGLITSALPSFRVLPEGSTFDKGGSSIFVDDDSLYYYFLGLLNSSISLNLMKCLNITLNFQVRDIRNIPVVINNVAEVDRIVRENINISKIDWDSNEISWDYRHHFSVEYRKNIMIIEKIIDEYINFTQSQAEKLKSNEEELNRIFIENYTLNDELLSDIESKNISISVKDKVDHVKSFISYFMGCFFGRYSLDEEGLVYAGGEFDASRYKTFSADADNILPILPGAYFEDDIVSRFVDFVRVTFSEETLEENLDFIADALGRKKNETSRETLRRYFLNDFYKNHVQVYKKRPIYWLFTSGKEKAFNCLIYMHRYDKTTLSRIRTDYLHEVQTRLDAEKVDLLSIINGDSTTKEISSAKKELKSLDKKIDELKAYDELLHHMADMQIEIDLDDGVKVNYEKFKGLMAKI